MEGFEFQHDLITPYLDRQAACLSLLKCRAKESWVRLVQVAWALFKLSVNEREERGTIYFSMVWPTGSSSSKAGMRPGLKILVVAVNK